MAKIVVAVPVREEVALIGDCLRALALPNAGDSYAIVLLVNNSRDGTADLARALRPTLPCPVHVIEHEFCSDQANAGHARRLAVEHACTLAEPDGIVITTDADGCVAADWLDTQLAAFAAGADVVCGRAMIDPVDALRIPQHLHADDAVEVAYGAALDRLASLLDPDLADPWPRHAEESGASIAVRRGALLAAGGVPAVKVGEDRALVAALRRRDARIRHDPAVLVTVSGRTEGRAANGMADTIRRRMIRQDPEIDDAMEPAAARVRRIGLRRLLRLAWAQDAGSNVCFDLAAELAVAPDDLRQWLNAPHFGAAWAMVELHSPRLVRQGVRRSDVAAQLRLARDTLSRLETTLAIQSAGLIRPDLLDGSLSNA